MIHMPLKLKAVSLHWEMMFTRSLFGTPDMAEQGKLLNEVAAAKVCLFRDGIPSWIQECEKGRVLGEYLVGWQNGKPRSCQCT